MYWWKVAVLKGPLELRRCFFVFFFSWVFQKVALVGLFGASLVGFQKIIGSANDFTSLQFFCLGGLKIGFSISQLRGDFMEKHCRKFDAWQLWRNVMKWPDLFNCSDLLENYSI